MLAEWTNFPNQNRDFSFLRKQLRRLSLVLDRTLAQDNVLTRLACGFFDDLYDNQKDLRGRFLRSVVYVNQREHPLNLARIRQVLNRSLGIWDSLQADIEKNLLPNYEKALDDQIKEMGMITQKQLANLEKGLFDYYELIKHYRHHIKNHEQLPHLWELAALVQIPHLLFHDQKNYPKIKNYLHFIIFKIYLNQDIPYALLKRVAEWDPAFVPENDHPDLVQLKIWCEEAQKKENIHIFMKGIESFIHILNDRYVSPSFPRYELGSFLLSLSRAGYPLDKIHAAHMEWRASLRKGQSYKELAYQRPGQKEWLIPELGSVLVGKNFGLDAHVIFELNAQEVMVIGCNRVAFHALALAQKQEACFLKTPSLIYTDPKGLFLVKERLHRLDLEHYERALKALFLTCIAEGATPLEIEAKYLLFDKTVVPPELKSVKGLMKGTFNVMALEKLTFDLFSTETERYKNVMRILEGHEGYAKTYAIYQNFFMDVLKQACREKSPKDYEDAFAEAIEDLGVIQAGKDLYHDVRGLLEECLKWIDSHYVSKARVQNGSISQDLCFFEIFEKNLCRIYRENGGFGRLWLNASEQEFMEMIIEQSQLFEKKIFS